MKSGKGCKYIYGGVMEDIQGLMCTATYSVVLFMIFHTLRFGVCQLSAQTCCFMSQGCP